MFLSPRSQTSALLFSGLVQCLLRPPKPHRGILPPNALLVKEVVVILPFFFSLSKAHKRIVELRASLLDMHYSQQHWVIYEAAHKTSWIPTPRAPTWCCLSEKTLQSLRSFSEKGEEKNAFVGQSFLLT